VKLRQIFEAPGKTAVAAFGRMNPPTIGHKKLIDTVKKQKGDHFLFLSHTQKPKTDPLPHNVKKQYAVNFFKDITIGDNEVRTPIQMLQKLEKQGYTDVVYVAGSDRVEQFDKLFNDYNGKEYNFNSIKVISAGERDPDAEGAEGMSASKMRLAAAEGNLEAFAQGVPDKKLAKNLYQAVRSGMGIKDEVPAEEDVTQGNFGGVVYPRLPHEEVLDAISSWEYGDTPIELSNGYVINAREEGYNDDDNAWVLLDPQGKMVDHGEGSIEGVMQDFTPIAIDEGIRPEKPSKSSEELIAMGYAPDSDKVQRAREYEDWADDQRAKGKEIDEGDLVLDKMALLSYLRDRIYDWASKEEDIDKISDILKQIEGKTVKARDGKRYTISDEDIEEVLQQLRTEDAPPGREKQVKALKKKFDDEGAPYAIAWAQHNKHGKPKRKNRG
jgi:nicotinic acid mononucleotide adenylyltransferase